MPGGWFWLLTGHSYAVFLPAKMAVFRFGGNLGGNLGGNFLEKLTHEKQRNMHAEAVFCGNFSTFGADNHRNNGTFNRAILCYFAKYQAITKKCAKKFGRLVAMDGYIYNVCF